MHSYLQNEHYHKRKHILQVEKITLLPIVYIIISNLTIVFMTCSVLTLYTRVILITNSTRSFVHDPHVNYLGFSSNYVACAVELLENMSTALNA